MRRVDRILRRTAGLRLFGAQIEAHLLFEQNGERRLPKQGSVRKPPMNAEGPRALSINLSA